MYLFKLNSHVLTNLFYHTPWLTSSVGLYTRLLSFNFKIQAVLFLMKNVYMMWNTIYVYYHINCVILYYVRVIKKK